MTPATIERRDRPRRGTCEVVFEEGDDGEDVDEGEADTQTEKTQMNTKHIDARRREFEIVTFDTSRVPDDATLGIARRLKSRERAQLRSILTKIDLSVF